MTSVSIISGVTARIRYLMNDPTDSQSSLLPELESINQLLSAADLETKESKEFVDLEKQIVQLSYNIDDVIEAKELEIPSKPKGICLSNCVRPSVPSSEADLEKFTKELVSLKKNLENVIEESPGSEMPKEIEESPGSEMPKEMNTSPAQTSDPAESSKQASTGEEDLRLDDVGSEKQIVQHGRPSIPSSEGDLGTSEIELVSLKNNVGNNVTYKSPAGSEEMTKEQSTSPAQTSHPAESSKQASTGEEDPLGGTENKVREALLSENFSVVSILGKSGMGKTTLAEKVFYHPEVRQLFKVFAWVPIHQDCQAKKVLQDILLQLLPNKKADIKGMNEIQLTQEILKLQKNNGCLFVLDGVGTVQDWQSIRVALLLGKSSKILITTPSNKVAEMATSSKDEAIHSLEPLTEAECFKILKEKASFDDQELQKVGEIIFHLSQGSPLFAVILGKCLKTENAAARDHLVKELDKYRSRSSKGEKQEEQQVLGLCYQKLSDELKPCLLYMGQFPEGQDIEVEKLHLLLAAEDLISPGSSGTTKEIMESLRDILEKLALHELVEVEEDKGSMLRMYKSCRLRDQIRKSCKTEGLDEEFFEIVEFESGKNVSTRRLAIYLSNYKDGDAIPFISQDTVKKIRSFLIFDTYESEQKSTWPSELNDLKEFSHLRVLDFDGVDFGVRKIPRGMDKLIFLRYLSFRGCWLEAFPPSIRELPFLETLDLRVHTDCKMTIPNVLVNMKRLRHLYFPMLYESRGDTELQLSGLERLEILVNFDTGACDAKDLSQLNKLQILAAVSDGRHKDLEAIITYLDEAPANLQLSVIIRNFDCYTGDRVTIFKKLLECKSLHSLHIEGQIGQLPEDVAISPNITEMLFDGSEIEDDPVNVLGELPNLQSLVLSNDAVLVNEILFLDASMFPNLRSLKLLNLQYLEKLKFGKGATPKLSTLVIEKCDYLEKVLIPEELHNRLQLAQGKKGDDVYSVEPLLSIIHDN